MNYEPLPEKRISSESMSRIAAETLAPYLSELRIPNHERVVKLLNTVSDGENMTWENESLEGDLHDIFSLKVNNPETNDSVVVQATLRDGAIRKIQIFGEDNLRGVAGQVTSAELEFSPVGTQFQPIVRIDDQYIDEKNSDQDNLSFTVVTAIPDYNKRINLEDNLGNYTETRQYEDLGFITTYQRKLDNGELISTPVAMQVIGFNVNNTAGDESMFYRGDQVEG